MVLRYLLVLTLLSGLVLRSSGQLSFGGAPASFEGLKLTSYPIPFIEMEPVDNHKLLLAEKKGNRHLKSLHFAKSFDVDLSPSAFGQWISNGDMKIWRLGIRSTGAYSLNLIFDKMIIPDGASLFIYNLDHTKVLGAFTSGSEQSSGHFATFPIAGDQVVVEYNEPKSATYPGELHISSVNHDFKNAFGSRPLGESGLCNMDVYCPDATKYLTEKQSVVCLLINGNTLCTGTLINNTKQDNTPYLLTAGHCIETESDAQQTIFCFNYESPSCGNGQSSINGYVDQTLSGAFLKARSDSLDFSLLLLETPPPDKFRPYYAGWDHSLTSPSSSVAISHPLGDVKKITKDNNSPTIGSFDVDFKSNSFWIIGKWEIGTTEGGSSGCSLFNQDNLIVGTLTGGTSTCIDPTNDIFAMFSKQWDTNTSKNYQLKYWLDPLNTGKSKLEGHNPFEISDSCSLFTNANIGDKYMLPYLPKPLNGYKTGHNTLKITSYAERFTRTSQTVLSSVSIGVGKVSSVVSNSYSKIVLKIYSEDANTNLPGNELISMDLPFSLLKAKKMNYIQLENPLTIKGRYFIGFDINYTNVADTFAVYYDYNRVQTDKNYAYAKSAGSWKPFYWLPELGISTSLMINANGCQSTLGIDTTTNIGTGEAKFQVLYPESGISNYVLLRNKGTREDGVVNIYDIAGRKLVSASYPGLSITPQSVSLAQYPTGIYFLTVETTKTRQTFKIVVRNAQ